MDLLPPPDGFAYRVDAAGRVVVNRTTGLPKLVPIESSSVGPFPAMDINMTAPPGEMVGATVPLLPRISTTPKSVARSESTRSETKPRRFGARKKKTELLNFVPEAARQIKNSTKQTFESVTDFAIGDGPGDAAQDALRGMSTFVQDFFKFLARGNVLDLAVGIIVGNAFTCVARAGKPIVLG